MNCRHFDGACYKREEEGRTSREWGVGSGTLMCVGVCGSVWKCVSRLVMQLPGIKRHVRIEVRLHSVIFLGAEILKSPREGSPARTRKINYI